MDYQILSIDTIPSPSGKKKKSTKYTAALITFNSFTPPQSRFNRDLRDFLSTSLEATILPPQNLRPVPKAPEYAVGVPWIWDQSSHLRMGGGWRVDKFTWYRASNSSRVQQEPPAACRWQQ